MFVVRRVKNIFVVQDKPHENVSYNYSKLPYALCDKEVVYDIGLFMQCLHILELCNQFFCINSLKLFTAVTQQV